MLTVIVFTYNHGKYISKCLDSIIEQKTEYSYKIHIWDDCSTDKTTDICRTYQSKYPELIELTVQPKNTFCGPYEEMQSLAAIRSIDTPYFCIIDGDDYWCDENKIQIALNFLENNKQFIGFAHDTYQVDANTGVKSSYVHDCLKLEKIDNPVSFSSKAPFFLTSSRVFRKQDYSSLGILPIDYLLYHYYLSRGPIFYYDKIMAAYVVGNNSTFASQSTQMIRLLNAMFAYKLFLLFGEKEHIFCKEMLLKYCIGSGSGDKYFKRLNILVNIFGISRGWKLFMYLNFVPRFGRDCLNINYIYADRQKVKDKVDSRVQLEQAEQKDKPYADQYKSEIQRFLHKLEECYNCSGKATAIDSNTITLFNNIALTAYGREDLDTLNLVEQKYPEFKKHIYNSYRSFILDYPKIERKYRKYKKLFRITSVALLLQFLAMVGFVLDMVKL